jgi:hypothetical protein
MAIAGAAGTAAATNGIDERASRNFAAPHRLLRIALPRRLAKRILA